MAYFEGEGVKGKLHPSLKAYIDSFHSNPFPKMFPRGGGIWDQDPILMRDFRIILGLERKCKEIQRRQEEAKQKTHSSMAGHEFTGEEGGGGLGLDEALNEYLESIGEDGLF